MARRLLLVFAMTISRRALAIAILALLSVSVHGCTGDEDVGTATQEIGNTVKSQLRGYDLGPPFPAGLRDSGLINGYAESEWVPFVAVIDGKKLQVADEQAGSVGDGLFEATLIVPTYSPRHDANAISEIATSGTYGLGALTPIPNPFDNRWLIDNGYEPFVLGAYSASGAADYSPSMGQAVQRTGPTRFGGDVSSVSVAIQFQLPADSERAELLVAVRLAPPDLAPISPAGQGFPGTDAGTAKGAGSFFPGPGPIFVGYHVGKPTGIATVPIRVDRHHCESDDECVPGQFCVGAPEGVCNDPCIDDSNCPSDEICEDGVCVDPPPPCEEQEDCEGELTCIGGNCLPDCPTECGDPEFCDPFPCVPPGGDPPCVYDEQCSPGNVCEDGVCQEPPPPCDMSCPTGTVCQIGQCVPPDMPCDYDEDCPGGELCMNGSCTTGIPPCAEEGCGACEYDAQCPGGLICAEGTCVTPEPPLPCDNDAECPSGQECAAGYCDIPEPCPVANGECPAHEICAEAADVCIPEHPPIPCSGTGDCPAGDTCLGGYCAGEPPGDPCKNDNKCKGDDVCNNGHCTPPPDSCNDDADCGAGNCEGGYCVPPHPPIPCTDTAECPGGDECTAGYCQPPLQCVVDHECPGGELCENGTCRPGQPPEGCVVDSDCPPQTEDDVYPAVCFSGFCTPSPGSCEASDDCPGGYGCVDGVCVPVGDPDRCVTVYDCEGGHLCIGGVCRPGLDIDECETTSDCPANSYDDVNINQCIGGVCTVPGNSVTECTSVANCAPGYTCAEGTCIEEPGACHLDGDCPESLSCIAGWCGQPCDSDDNCGDDDVCASGRCSAPCTTYEDCDAYEACIEGGCVPNPYVVQNHNGDQSLWEVDVPGQQGCACRAGGGDSPRGWWLMALVAVCLTRRRRR